MHDARDPRIQTAADVGEASYWWLVIAIVWVVGRYVASRRRARHDAELARMREAALAAAEKDAVSRERLRIAHELHDVVAHNIGVVALQAGAALELLDESPERVREPLLAVEATARTTLREMRNVVGALRAVPEDDSGAPQPVLTDLETLAASVTKAGLPVEVTVDGHPRTLPASLELCAYRIVQEALTNSLKHALRAQRVRVHLRHDPQRLTLTVTDDGRRDDASTKASGHGLIGMRERVAFHGGTLTAAPGPDGGFRVHAVLPLPEDDA